MVDNHQSAIVPGSKTLSALVGVCRTCGRECCNCKQCVLAKGTNFNLCAACFRKPPLSMNLTELGKGGN